MTASAALREVVPLAAPSEKRCFTVVVEGPTPPGFMQPVWRDDARFVDTYWNGIAGRPVDLDLYMSNAFDAYYQATGAVSGLALGFNSAIYGPPRQYGFRVRYHFGG